ncbi:MAG: hypothetical protein CMB77_04300 [Euryarchaeota archaeon]|nr:hypothetical protein [Euryarchaeota archaeon]
MVNTTGAVTLLNFLDLSKEKSLFGKAAKFKIALQKIYNDYSISDIVIEENLQAFRPGLSSAKTIVTLARFNGVCTYIASEVFGINPEFMNVNAARKLVGIKINRKSKKSTKEQILEFVQNKDSSLQWPTKVLKSGPRRGNVILVKECYDMADAYIIAQSAVIQEEHCQEQKK